MTCSGGKFDSKGSAIVPGKSFRTLANFYMVLHQKVVLFVGSVSFFLGHRNF